MTDYDVTQILVAGQRTGIIGLTEVLRSTAETHAGRPDAEIREALVDKLSMKNYISGSAREKYAQAFLREYKKFVGEPVEDEASSVVSIKVLGPGCPNCRKLEQDLMTLVAETKIPADIEHVTDLKEIGRYGVMGSPALIIGGKVMAVGNMPPKSELKEWLLRAFTESSGG